MRADLKGLDVVVACSRKRHVIVGDEAQPEATDDGLAAAVQEVLGFDFGQVTPYLSAFASGFGGGGAGGGQMQQADMAKKQAELEMQKREAERKAASSKTTLLVVLGVLGAGLLGTGVYLAARK